MPDTMTVCPSCGTPQPSGANYCSKCGQPVSPGGPDGAREERNARRAKYLIIFGYCLVIAGIPMTGTAGHYMLGLGFCAVFAGCQWLALQ